MRLGSILKIAPVFLFLLLAPLSVIASMGELDALLPEEATALEDLFDDFDGEGDEDPQNHGKTYLGDLRDQLIADAVQFYFVVYSGTTSDPQPLRAAKVDFSDFEADDDDDNAAYALSVNAEITAGLPTTAAGDKLLMVHQASIMDEILNDPSAELADYVYDNPAVKDLGYIYLLWGSEFDEDAGQGNELSDGEYFWDDLTPVYRDGDVDVNFCQGIGQDEYGNDLVALGVWDLENNGNLVCCGDDGLDHGTFSRAEYHPDDISPSHEQALGNDHLMSNPNVLVPSGQVCNVRSANNWLRAEDNKGEVITMMGYEIAAVSSGLDENSEAVWKVKSDNPCTPEYYVDVLTTNAYLHVDHTDDTAPAPDRGRWFICSEFHTNNDDPQAGGITFGGVNKDLGDIVTCGGSTFVCAPGGDDGTYDWQLSGSFEEIGDNAEACSSFGDLVGYSSYTWTGSRCCMAGYQEDGNYVSPATYVDDYEFSSLPLQPEEEWEDAGVCIMGKHFATDTKVPRKVQDWLVNYGTVQGCGPESNFVGQTKPAQNTGDYLGQDLVVPNEYCTVKNGSLPDLQQQDVVPEFVCSPTGNWIEYDKAQFEDQGLTIKYGRPDGNLAPNPTLSS